MRLNLRRISFFEVTALPEFKEKPKMGEPKVKRRDMLLPKQAARIMKEKYLQELDQRPEGPENTEKTLYARRRAFFCWCWSGNCRSWREKTGSAW